MPETFGGGIGSPAYDPRSIPLIFGAKHLNTGEIWTVSKSENNLWIVTTVDITSDGGGAGGQLIMAIATSGVVVCSFNIGSSIDAFSWRGYLPIPANPAGILTFDNTSDRGLSIVCAGFASPYIAF